MRHAPYAIFSDSVSLAGRGAATSVSRAGAVVANLVWLLGMPRRVAAVRRDMALLGGMSDGELADIGLNRQDVWDAAALPLGAAPEPLLTRRAAERRRADMARRR